MAEAVEEVTRSEPRSVALVTGKYLENRCELSRRFGADRNAVEAPNGACEDYC